MKLNLFLVLIYVFASILISGDGFACSETFGFGLEIQSQTAFKKTILPNLQKESARDFLTTSRGGKGKSSRFFFGQDRNQKIFSFSSIEGQTPKLLQPATRLQYFLSPLQLNEILIV